MKKIVRRGLIATAATAAAATVAFAAPALAYQVPAGHTFGEYVGTNSAGTIATVDMNVGSPGAQYYHEYDLAFTPALNGFTFTGVGKQFDNDGESITGVIDTTNHTLSFTSNYWSGGAPDSRVWSISGASIAATPTSGFVDWTGNWGGMEWDGSINIPAVAPPVPAPTAGNHGQCVSGATHAGIKGKALAQNYAGIATRVGEYGSSTCPAGLTNS